MYALKATAIHPEPMHLVVVSLRENSWLPYQRCEVNARFDGIISIGNRPNVIIGAGYAQSLIALNPSEMRRFFGAGYAQSMIALNYPR